MAGIGGMSTRFGSGGGHVDDLIAAYALGALDPAERADVDRHCRVCARCARLVVEERRVVGLLPLAVPSAVPAPDVKLALFARVAQAQAPGERGSARPSPMTGRERALLPPTLTIPSSRPTSLGAPAGGEAPVGGVVAKRRSRFGWGGAVLTVPLLVALVATGAWGWQLRGQVQSQNASANFGSSAPLVLQGDQGRGQLFIGADERQAKLLMDLDKPNAGGDYELLGMNEDGEAVPLSELEVDGQGRVEKTFSADRSLKSFQRLQIQARADKNGVGTTEPVLSVSPNGSIGSQNPTANDALP
jgi:hypothetical protein